MTAIMIQLSPTVHNELSRQVAVARMCPSCSHYPVLVVEDGSVEVRDGHKPGCRQARDLRAALRVVPGGEPA